MALLATTALEWTWGENEPVVFLGEWCRRYARAASWSKRRYVVVRNHWDDGGKLHRDQLYLRALHDELLGELGLALCRVHGLERSRRFWQTLLDPWLARYVGVAFDRWESLRVAFEEHDCSHSIVQPVGARAPLRDHFSFLAAVTGDEWNHDFYADVLRYEYAGRCTLSTHPDSSAEHGHEDALSKALFGSSWRRTVSRSLDRLCGRWSRGNDIAFVQTYFPLGALTHLNVSLGQIPIPRLGEFSWPDSHLPHLARCDAQLRAQLRPQREPKCRFESFLHERIQLDLPQVLVESFGWMRERAAAIASRPSVIFSASAHWFNDLFKHWLAERVRAGTVFVAMEHGGAIPPKYSAMNFEEDVSDVRTTWALPYHPKHRRLPPNRFAGHRNKNLQGTRLLVIGSESPRYAYDVASTPVAGQTLECFEHVCRLHDGLDGPAKRAFLVKPYPVDLGWCLRERYVARLGESKVCADPDLKRVLRTARLAVCTYPQTTFSQAMLSGAPALLVYPRHLWETVASFDGLIETLCSAQLAFFDPEAAAAHICRIWSDPWAWWDSPAVLNARHSFEAQALDMRTDWIGPWLEFVRSLKPARAHGRSWIKGSGAE
jgi:putative transferase (TIGR04331 family)